MRRPNKPAPARATLVFGAEFPVAEAEEPDAVPDAVLDAVPEAWVDVPV